MSDIVSLSLVSVRNGKHGIVPDVENTPYTTSIYEIRTFDMQFRAVLVDLSW